MIVISLTDCPPSLRGDLSKWLLEINTGVYVGQVSARVRDELWERVTKNIRDGRATLVFDAANEQKMDFRIHNTSWELVDCDGLRLVRRPSQERNREKMEKGEIPGLPNGFSKAAKQQMLRRVHPSKAAKNPVSDYTVIDIETSGLDSKKDEIIELAALRVRNNEIVSEFCTLVYAVHPLSDDIIKLTGITDDVIQKNGIPLKDALPQLIDFIASDVLLIHNAEFDISFLKQAAEHLHINPIRNHAIDTCMLARKKFLKVSDYRLSTLAGHFHIAQPVQHRALPDCYVAHAIYQSLIQTE